LLIDRFCDLLVTIMKLVKIPRCPIAGQFSSLIESARVQGILCCLSLSMVLVGCFNDEDDDIVDPGVAVPSTVTANFDWEMAERTRSVINMDFKPEVNVAHRMIEGPTPGEPGLYGGVASVPLDQINPADGYELTFDACASIAAEQYTWSVDGKEIAKTATCLFSTRLSEGAHEVILEVEGGGLTDSVTETVMVEDILLVIMGDSYSSGEGNATQYQSQVPDSTLDEAIANNGAGWSEGGYWDHANCHRSTRSGFSNAVIDLEKADPHSSVTTIYVACSGAQVDSGILGIKEGYLGGLEQAQTKQAYDLTLAKGRKIDGIIIGIGGNDIGFVPVVAECVLQDDCFFSTERSLSINVPDLPVIEPTTPVDPDALARLTLNPNTAFPELPPGPPYRILERQTLHACQAVFQNALLADGGIGPQESCRQSIGTSPAGLSQVARCLSGNGQNDCVSVPTYYDFSTGQYSFPGGDSWPGLSVPADRIFYTEYPDLTTVFASGDPQGSLEFCQISLTKDQLMNVLKIAHSFADDPALVDVIVGALERTNLANLGLTQNEFEYASKAILGGFENTEPRVLVTDLVSSWNVKAPGGPLAKTTIGPSEPVEFVNIGSANPALNGITRRSQSLYGWVPTTGTFELASGHGLCAPQGVNLDSNAAYAYLIGPAQGTNVSGSAHPNLLGQETYRKPIATALNAVFGL
jgi:hypothetical protein